MRRSETGALGAVFVVMSLTACTEAKVDGSKVEPAKAVASEPAPSLEPESEPKPEAKAELTPEPEPAAKQDTEPELVPEPELAPEALAKAAAGEGFSVGQRPKLTPIENADPDTVTAALSRTGVEVSASAHAQQRGEYEYTTELQIRVEFAERGLTLAHGLNWVGGGGDDYCDELLPEAQDIASLDDGRWLVDAQLACRNGEDYFSATNEHVLILIDPARPHVEQLWTGNDSGSNAMGVCVSSSVHGFEVEGSTLVIHKTEVTRLDEEDAKDPRGRARALGGGDPLKRDLPAAAEGCVPSPEKDQVVKRIELGSPATLAAPL